MLLLRRDNAQFPAWIDVDVFRGICYNIFWIFFLEVTMSTKNNGEKKQKKRRGLTLLKKGHKGLVYALFSRFGIVVLLLLVQITIFVVMYNIFKDYIPHFYIFSTAFTVAMVLYLINSRMNPCSKITWLVIIMIMPVFGSLLLWYIQSDIGHRALKKRADQLLADTMGIIPQDPEIMRRFSEEAPGPASTAVFMQRSGCRPVYSGTDAVYFPSGEAKFEELLEQLQKAEHFIFLEYFIIDEGVMWGQILEILAQKAKLGVDVRVMYDGTCEFSRLPHSYPKKLEYFGIKCKVFAPLSPFVSTHYNYRDHRKILVIDGKVAFTGGVNFADEYINEIHRFGHWKDTAIMLKGEAVRSFTLMFLQMWGMTEKRPELEYEKFLTYPADSDPLADGFVLPYGDCPLNGEKLGERMYMDILNRAVKYVHIMTPYLILDGEMETALKFAAERGVDVRIILPGIPDKKIAYSLAKTHYRSLIESGVKIYEYTPGFVHAKVFVADDREAVVGSINLDYRSFYHHFECAAYMYGTDCIPAVREDFLETQQECREVTPEIIRHENLLMKITGFIMKAVAPLM